MKLDFSELSKGLADVCRALATRDLREPANIEALLDVVLWVVVIVLSGIYALFDLGSPFSMFVMVFWITVASFVWLIFHYTVRQYIGKR